jgi:hypothetical protein
MLGVRNAATIAELWDAAESKAALPTSAEEFFAASGPQPEHTNCSRAHERYYLRCRAIIKHDCQTHAVYLQDCSRTGMGLLSPVQLFPRQRIQMWMDNQRSYQLEVTRCRRIGPNCYECGTVFILK